MYRLYTSHRLALFAQYANRLTKLLLVAHTSNQSYRIHLLAIYTNFIIRSRSIFQSFPFFHSSSVAFRHLLPSSGPSMRIFVFIFFFR